MSSVRRKMNTNSLLDRFSGHYYGNVQSSMLSSTFAKLFKTGGMSVEQTTSSVTISTWSTFTNQLKLTFSKTELQRFFPVVQNEEQRVSFQRVTDDSYGFLHKWLGGLTSTTVEYQLKFNSGELIAFRVQRWNSSQPEKLTYFLEVNKVKSVGVPKDEASFKTVPQPIPNQRRDDWNF